MLLAIDTGNTQTHIGIFKRDRLVAQWRTSTEPRRTADELALILQQFLSFQGLSFSREVTGVVIGSVLPAPTPAPPPRGGGGPLLPLRARGRRGRHSPRPADPDGQPPRGRRRPHRQRRGGP